MPPREILFLVLVVTALASEKPEATCRSAGGPHGPFSASLLQTRTKVQNSVLNAIASDGEEEQLTTWGFLGEIGDEVTDTRRRSDRRRSVIEVSVSGGSFRANGLGNSMTVDKNGMKVQTILGGASVGSGGASIGVLGSSVAVNSKGVAVSVGGIVEGSLGPEGANIGVGGEAGINVGLDYNGNLVLDTGALGEHPLIPSRVSMNIPEESRKAVEEVGDSLEDMGEQFAETAAELGGVMVNTVEDIGDGLSHAWDETKNFVEDGFKKAVEVVGEELEKMGALALSAAKAIGEGLKGAWDTVTAFTNCLGKVLDFDMGQLMCKMLMRGCGDCTSPDSKTGSWIKVDTSGTVGLRCQYPVELMSELGWEATGDDFPSMSNSKKGKKTKKKQLPGKSKEKPPPTPKKPFKKDDRRRARTKKSLKSKKSRAPDGSCSGRLSTALEGEILFAPALELEVTKTGDITVKVSATAIAQVNALIEAEGTCDFAAQRNFPAKPKVKTMCKGPVCIVVMVQGVLAMSLSGVLSGAVSASIEAEWGVAAQVVVNVEGTADTPKVEVDELKHKKSLEVAGSMDMDLQFSMGPHIMVMPMPGVPVDMNPMITLQLKGHGQFDFSPDLSKFSVDPSKFSVLLDESEFEEGPQTLPLPAQLGQTNTSVISSRSFTYCASFGLNVFASTVIGGIGIPEFMVEAVSPRAIATYFSDAAFGVVNAVKDLVDEHVGNVVKCFEDATGLKMPGVDEARKKVKEALQSVENNVKKGIEEVVPNSDFLLEVPRLTFFADQHFCATVVGFVTPQGTDIKDCGEVTCSPPLISLGGGDAEPAPAPVAAILVEAVESATNTDGTFGILGNSLTNHYPRVDSARFHEFIDTSHAFPIPGAIVSVKFVIKRANQDIRFRVYRPVSGNRYQMVGETEVIKAKKVGVTESHILKGPLIVEAGDVMGWADSRQGTLAWEYGGKEKAVCWRSSHTSLGKENDFVHCSARKYAYSVSYVAVPESLSFIPDNFQCNRKKSLCVKVATKNKNAFDAIAECQSLGARVCTHADMQELCGSGMNPYKGSSSGWYGDHGTAPGGNWDDEFGTWNRDKCAHNNDGPASHGRDVKAFRCCRSGELPEHTSADCPSGLTKLGTTNREVCTGHIQSATDMYSAVRKCRSVKGHVCKHKDMFQLCQTGNPFQESRTGWYGDHALASRGNWDDEYGTWNQNSCNKNNDGPGYVYTHRFRYRCCGGSDQVVHRGVTLRKVCLPGFSQFGDICYYDPQKDANMHGAIGMCQSFHSHVCDYVEMQTVCAYGTDPYGQKSGWYGDHGTASRGNWDDEFGTWNQDNCERENNDGPAEHANSVKPFRCCSAPYLPNLWSAMEVPTGYVCTDDRSLCYSAGNAAANIYTAISLCSAHEARVCTHGDMQELCGHGVDPYEGVNKGWYGDHGKAPGGNWDDEYGTWNVGRCQANNDGPAQGGLTDLHFRCCRSGVLPKIATAACPRNLASMSTQNGEICLSTLRGNRLVGNNHHDAIKDCRALKGHVCLHNEMQQLCAKGNPYQGANKGWYGDHGTAGNGNWDDEFGTWNNGKCEANNDGPAAHAQSPLKYRCCAASGAVNLAGTIIPKKCDDGFAKFGGLCFLDPGKGEKSMHGAIQTCSDLKSHVCEHVEMQEICAYGWNPYSGSREGWYGDHGTAHKGNWDDEFGTWNRDHCDLNNDGPAKQANDVKAFRCCKRARVAFQ